jgi:hypothetical protein
MLSFVLGDKTQLLGVIGNGPTQFVVAHWYFEPTALDVRREHVCMASIFHSSNKSAAVGKAAHILKGGVIPAVALSSIIWVRVSERSNFT